MSEVWEIELSHEILHKEKRPKKVGSEQTHGGQQKQNLLYDMTLKKNCLRKKCAIFPPPLPPHLSIGLFCILHSNTSTIFGRKDYLLLVFNFILWCKENDVFDLDKLSRFF